MIYNDEMANNYHNNRNLENEEGNNNENNINIRRTYQNEENINENNTSKKGIQNIVI